MSSIRFSSFIRLPPRRQARMRPHAVVLCLLLAGCVLPGVEGRPRRGLLRGEWLPGDLHVHTRASEDASLLGDPLPVVICLARDHGLGFLAITDHRQVTDVSAVPPEGRLVVLLSGEEWGTTGHAGILGVASAISEARGLRGEALLADVTARMLQARDEGAVRVINHPTRPGDPWLYSVEEMDAVEVWNQFWSFRSPPMTSTDLAFRIANLDIPAHALPPGFSSSVESGSGGGNRQAVRYWEAILDRGVRIGAVGGGDRHYLFPPGHPTTYVYTAERTPQAILQGIRAHATFVSRSPDGPQVELTADLDDDGLPDRRMGESLPVDRDVRIAITVNRALGGRVVLYRGRGILADERIPADDFTLWVMDRTRHGTWYRVEVLEPIGDETRFPGLEALPRSRDISPTELLAIFQKLLPHLERLPADRDFPFTFRIPEALSRLLNEDSEHPGYCMGAITSAIYVE